MLHFSGSLILERYILVVSSWIVVMCDELDGVFSLQKNMNSYFPYVQSTLRLVIANYSVCAAPIVPLQQK